MLDLCVFLLRDTALSAFGQCCVDTAKSTSMKYVYLQIWQSVSDWSAPPPPFILPHWPLFASSYKQ